MKRLRRLWRWFEGPEGDVRTHRILLNVWLLVTAMSIPTGWINSIAFVAACSLYANVAAHWGALNAAKSEVEVRKSDS